MKKVILRCGLVMVVFAVLFTALAISSDRAVTIFMIGDSTMANKPVDDNPERGWGQMFGLFFDNSVRIENHARNGRSTRSFLHEGLWQPVLDSIQPGDFVFIQFGHNDQKKEKVNHYTSPEDYGSNLIRFVREARERGGVPVLCTPIMRRRFDTEGKFYDVHGAYPDRVREVAREYDVPMIDMHRKSEALIVEAGVEGSKDLFLFFKPGVYGSLPNGKEDNTHFSELGATKMAALAVEGIRELHLPLETRLKQ